MNLILIELTLHMGWFHWTTKEREYWMIPSDPSHLPKTFSTYICKMMVYKLKLWLSSSQASMSSPWTPLMSTFWTSNYEASSSLSNLESLSGSKSLKFARMSTNFSTLALVSLLRAFVCVFPNKNRFSSEAADNGGIWRMMKATGERASDPQSPFHQVADEIQCLAKVFGPLELCDL